MTFRGRFENGVVVFARRPSLRNGQEVRVTAAGRGRSAVGKRPKPGTAAALLKHAGIWANQQDEVHQLLDDLRRSKQVDLERERLRLGLSSRPRKKRAGK